MADKLPGFPRPIPASFEALRAVKSIAFSIYQLQSVNHKIGTSICLIYACDGDVNNDVSEIHTDLEKVEDYAIIIRLKD